VATSAEKSAQSFPAAVKRRRRRSRSLSVQGEIRRSAKQIYEQGMAEAMKAAALLIVARKLDEVHALLVGSGVGTSAVRNTAVPPTTPATTPSPPAVKHPCVHCGRESIYKSKPNQFNRTGSWVCRVHMVLARSDEVEDQFDQRMNVAAQPAVAPAVQQQAFNYESAEQQPGASTMAEAFGAAQLVIEES